MKDFYGFWKHDKYADLNSHYKSIVAGIETLDLKPEYRNLVIKDVKEKLNNRLQEINKQLIMPTNEKV